ncbi:MAG: S9 family peptidase [Flavobacteriales bacterium]
MKEKSEAPICKKISTKLEKHGHVRIDDYYWLNDRENKEVIAYLNAENKYTEAFFKKTGDLRERLFNEMKSRIKEDDNSVPYIDNGYEYQTRYEKGDEYATHFRRLANNSGSKWEVLLNENEMSKDYSYFDLGSFEVSTNNELIAYSIDTVSRRQYSIYFKSIRTGEIFNDIIENTSGSIIWANDNKTIFYTKNDQTTLRSNQIYRHTIGKPQSEDALVFEEKNETFNCYVYKSKSKDYIIIGSTSTVSDEYRFAPANNPTEPFKVIQPRERGLEYSVSHFNDKFYIITNEGGATNFKLVEAPIKNPGKQNWKVVIPHKPDVYIEGIELFKNHMVVNERFNGLNRIKIIRFNNKNEHFIEFNDPTYTCYVGYNPDFESEKLRFGYSSLTTPSTTYEYDMNSKQKVVLKQQEVLGDFDATNYESERVFAKATDGTLIPMSVVYKKGLEKNGKNPTLQYAYGSYGASMDPYFSSSRLSLLDRGFIFVIAHIRGGQEMGRNWYEQGKMLNKKNTFTDFIACSEFLISESYTSPDYLFAMGGSAGGLLMGAVINLKPEIYKGIVAQVPFVDVVTTMLDESIPLTTGEYDEWGNPNDKSYYDYMLSYSPYDNVEAKKYPNMLVTTGLHDSQVQYWEPAKWVAKLRELKTDKNLLLLYCNMDAGHGGASGRFERLKEIALEYAFILRLAGKE